jgi:RHS repeat-associated protein
MPSGSIDYEYYPAGCDVASGCAPGKVASISSPSGVTLGYTYDGMLQVAEAWSGAVEGTVAKIYDNNFRTVGETITAAGNTASSAFSYDNDGLMTCASASTCPSGAGAMAIARSSGTGFVTGTTVGSVNDAYTYNSCGEPASYTARYGSTELYSVTYDSAAVPRDQLGRVVQKAETLEGATRVLGYSYDVQGRLTDVTEDGSLLEHYEYDLNGNRTHAVVAGQESDGVYDDQDRLLSYGEYTYTYTANGELLTKTGPEGTTTYAYDARGSLVAVDLPDGRLVEYVTDGKGRRVAKKVDGVTVQQWLYRDQLAPVAELDGTGTLVAQYVYGTKPNVPDLVIRGGETYRVVSDQLGSPVLAVNVANSGDVPFRAEFAAFGQVTGEGLDWMAFGFAGGLYDPDTGLVRFGARDYDPVVGRWVSKDPTGFAFLTDSRSNLYEYADSDPVNLLGQGRTQRQERRPPSRGSGAGVPWFRAPPVQSRRLSAHAQTPRTD